MNEIENDKDFPAFKAMLISNFSRLHEILMKHAVWMGSEHREAVTKNTLEIAWRNRELFKPSQEHITAWWNRCVFAARQKNYAVPGYDKPSRQTTIWEMRRLQQKEKTFDQLTVEARSYRSLFE